MASLAAVLVMASAFFAAWLVALYLCYATTMASRDSSSTCSSLCFVSSALVSDWASFFCFWLRLWRGLRASAFPSFFLHVSSYALCSVYSGGEVCCYSFTTTVLGRGGWVFVWTLSFCHFSQALRSCLFDKLFSPPRLFGCHGEQLLLFCNRSV